MNSARDRESFVRALNVSRETLASFERWQDMLRQWQQRINLVSPASLDDFWTRHALDGAQLAGLAPQGAKSFIDLGSGAGFPGLAIALMNKDKPDAAMTLVEANAKKAAFLRAVIAHTGAPAKVFHARIESVPATPHDVITARALAPLPRLLPLAARFAGPDTVMLFPKGRNVLKEVQAVRDCWALDYEVLPSLTDNDAAILKIGKARRV